VWWVEFAVDRYLSLSAKLGEGVSVVELSDLRWKMVKFGRRC